MKRWFGWTLATLLVAAVIFLLGPRVKLNTTLHDPKLPADLGKLEEQIRQSESAFADLRPNVEKKIVWANPQLRQQTPISVVFVHGFSATRKELDPLCLILARELRANLYYTRLRGHGRSGKAMADGSVGVWLNDVYHALEIGRRLGKRVLMVGSSTGSTLALWMAAQPQAQDLLALVLFSPNFRPKDPSAQVLLWPWGTQIATLIAGKEMSWQARNPEQAKYWTTTYPMQAVAEMMGLVKLLEAVDLRNIRIPVQVVFSPQDRVIDAGEIRRRFPQIGAKYKELVVWNQSQDVAFHVLVGDILNPQNTQPIAQRILQFLRPLLPPR